MCFHDLESTSLAAYLSKEVEQTDAPLAKETEQNVRTGFKGLTLLDAGGTGNLCGCDSNMSMQCLFNKAILCLLDSTGVQCADTHWDLLRLVG